jgi:hypothetical protein
MGWRSFTSEWKARREGRKHYANNIAKSARDVIGPTGWMWSNGWDAMEKGSKAYLKSFDPKVPRSIFLAEREGTRDSIPIPLIERCIEDWNSQDQPREDAPSA